MDAQKSIFVIESNDFVAQQLCKGLALHGYDGCVKIIKSISEAADSAAIKLSYPVRFGRVLDQVSSALSDGGQGKILNLGGARVDVHRGFYYKDEHSEAVRLTEKEVALLLLLYQANGEAVSRERMLDDVWQYATGVETHTLETHIYRLRQKIESDPANPKILQTNDSGYFLVLE